MNVGKLKSRTISRKKLSEVDRALESLIHTPNSRLALTCDRMTFKNDRLRLSKYIHFASIHKASTNDSSARSIKLFVD